MIALGIDVGTSSVKVLALDAQGRVLGTASAGYIFRHDPLQGSFEIDAEEWWQATCKATRECLAACRISSAEIALVGLTGNMSSVVLVDDSGLPVRPALLLADARGSAECGEVAPELLAEIRETTHNAPDNTAFVITKLLWLQRHAAPDIARAHAWLAAKDYVRLRLTGKPGVELTDAGNWLLVDTQACTWRWPWIEALGLPGRLFPHLHASADIVGGITPQAALMTGLREGTPVSAGAADMATAAIGSGTLRPGQLGVSMGTSTTLIAPLGSAAFPQFWRDKLTCHPFPHPFGNYALGSLLTGGLALNWLRSLQEAPQHKVELPQHPATSVIPADQEPGANKSGTGLLELSEAQALSPESLSPLVFLPYLAGYGTPSFDPQLRGTLFGLSPQSSLQDIYVALFEAVAFDIAAVIELLGQIPLDKIRVSSGGANLGIWLQIITDVAGIPVEVTAEKNVSALGAALLAACSSGMFAQLEEAVERVVAIQQVYRPRAHFAQAWKRRRQRYGRALALARDYYHFSEEERR